MVNVVRARLPNAQTSAKLIRQLATLVECYVESYSPKNVTGARVPEPVGAAEPQTQARTPCSASNRTPASTDPSGTTATIPTPMLTVASRSSRDTLPTEAKMSKIGAGRQVVRSRCTSQDSGIPLARFAAKPPPVMWLIACTSTAL